MRASGVVFVFVLFVLVKCVHLGDRGLDFYCAVQGL